MRLLQGFVALTVLSLSSVAFASTETEAQLYLHPAQPSDNGLGSQLTAPAFDDVLSKYLGVEDASQFKDDVKQRTVILFSGMDGIDLTSIIPSKLRNSHSVSSPPHISSFEALMNDYGQRIYDAQTPTIAAAQKIVNYFGKAAEEMGDALGSATNWVFGTAQNAASLDKKFIDETELAAGDVSRPFYQSLRSLIAYLDTMGKSASEEKDAGQSAYQALRFDGLQDIKASYGEKSPQFQRAVQMLSDVLNAAVDKMDAVHATRPQALALVFVPRSDEDASTLDKRGEPLAPFRGTIGVTPFLATRDLEDDVPSLVRQSTLAKSSDIPPESQLSGRCFTSEDDLNKATNKCSGRGKAIQSSKGGRKCYRCQCEKTDGKEWAGSACQRPDISKPFALLAVTTIGLVLVAFWSILYLFYEGEKELPSVLAGISIPKKQL
ncbi:uncharacterized protein FA14DRAFT_62561 [Meira miltonrushii]|uniref:Vacuolar sorting protein Vps3844 C-terminal domain-containing protein n=1 Tax=Meira miltonrushii TaxID=1280837 RepID=A0A316V7H0_9BASI|nr:uncharacterized protein FA14DRAFT_62561 [Meira miltonrushii]PWN33466.1 hypothetical protein FA14DRAFT_62561 [Meira miltonrushii]